MDVSVKIPEEDIILLNRLKNSLRARKVKVTQKELIDKAIKFGLANQEDFLQELVDQGKRSKVETTKEFFEGGERFDFGDNWLEDIDATL